MMKRSLTLAMAAAAVVAVTGCSSSDSGSKPFTGALVDSGIQGVTYLCGGVTGVTGPDGRFDCTTAPVSFSLGTITLGTIDNITSDYLVFPQDIAGIPRTEVSPVVANMAVLFQSLDNDGDPTNGITITPATVALLNDIATTPLNIGDYSASYMQGIVSDVVAVAVQEDSGSMLRVFSEETALANLALTVETPPPSPTQPGETTGSEGGN